jgi:hypothetical protein
MISTILNHSKFVFSQKKTMISQLGPKKKEDTKSTLNYSNFCPCASKNTMRTEKKFKKKNLKLNKINFKTSKIMNNARVTLELTQRET